MTAIHNALHVERMAERARALREGMPAAADALFVSLFLQDAGFPVPMTRDAEELVLRLLVGGWKIRRGPDETVSAGDVRVVTGGDAKPAELELVGKVALDGTWCYVLDGLAAPPYKPLRRALAHDPAAPLSYHLHFG